MRILYVRTYISYSHCYRPLCSTKNQNVRMVPLKMLRVSWSLVRLPCSHLRPLHTQRLLTVSLVLYIPWIPCDSFLVFIRRYRDSQDRNKFDESKLFLILVNNCKKQKWMFSASRKNWVGAILHRISVLMKPELFLLFYSLIRKTDKFKNSITKKSLCF